MHVGHDQEAVEQRTGGIKQREILLVGAHGEDQAFLRHGQKFGFEFADIHRRVLDQRRHLVEQVGVVAQAGVLARGLAHQLRVDVGAPLGEGRNHLAFGQQRALIRVGVGNLQFAAAHEAVSHGHLAGVEVEHPARHHAVAVQQDERVHRAHELRLARPPAHHLGNRQRLDGEADHLGEHRVELRAGNGVGVEQRLGLAVHAPLEGGHQRRVDALGGELLEQRRLGRAVGVEGHRHRHQFFGHFTRRRSITHTGDGHRQPPRRGKGMAARVGVGQIAGHQFGVNRARKALAQLGQCLGRQLFGEQFDEQGCGTHCAPSVAVAAPSIGKPSASREAK